MPHVQELPDDSELDVPLVPLTSSTLLAGAHHLGRQCQKANQEFMLCKEEEKDPRKCLKEGREVTRCVTDFFNTVKGNCAESFTEYMTCLDYNEQKLVKCRKHQAKFDTCMENQLGWKRPELGRIGQHAIVKTDRPLPIKDVRPKPEPVFIPEIPPDDQLPPAKAGTRFYFW
ncbi:NADH dehydrogenase [ubiquinone] 1 alpha subcomplex subunit 8-like [Amphiura filiformis]|uniref:NADH dehydrogenase [ubiquinone] 1 alpha subcomplex subunit 8-like n=1 Tax=Amphiura filiformis TaxID=82378 RepID=UPI003B21BFA8